MRMLLELDTDEQGCMRALTVLKGLVKWHTD